MAERKRYRRRPGNEVVAVRLTLDTDGFAYRKWGATQRCEAGDWLVDNDGDVYTVNADSFAATYRQVGRGLFEKHGFVWAEQAETAGRIATKEGATGYQAGDYRVFNDEAGEDGYAVTKEKFERLYEPAEGG